MIISPDLLLIKDDLYVWTPPRAGWAWRKSEDDFKQAIIDNPTLPVYLTVGLPGSGKSTWTNENHPDKIVFDATLTKLTDRNKVQKWAKESGATGVHCVFFDTDYQTCLERNDKRTVDRKISIQVMERMRNQLLPPSPVEGFLSLTVMVRS